MKLKKVRDEQRRINEQFLSDVRGHIQPLHTARGFFTFLLEQGGVNAVLFASEKDIYRNVAVHDFVIEKCPWPGDHC